MVRCSYFMPGGRRCGAVAMKGYETCYGHRPDLQEERKLNASRGGKAGGRGRPNNELAGIKREIKGVIAGVLSGAIETGPGAVAIQGCNALIRAVEVERRTFDMSDLLERLSALEERAERLRGA